MFACFSMSTSKPGQFLVNSYSNLSYVPSYISGDDDDSLEDPSYDPKGAVELSSRGGNQVGWIGFGLD